MKKNILTALFILLCSLHSQSFSAELPTSYLIGLIAGHSVAGITSFKGMSYLFDQTDQMREAVLEERATYKDTIKQACILSGGLIMYVSLMKAYESIVLNDIDPKDRPLLYSSITGVACSYFNHYFPEKLALSKTYLQHHFEKSRFNIFRPTLNQIKSYETPCFCLQEDSDEKMSHFTCGHHLHETCYDQFKETSSHCPSCRKELIPVRGE